MKKRLKIYKMATSMLLKFLTLKWNISRTIWRIEVGDGSLFCIFHALSFGFNLFFDRRFPLIQKNRSDKLNRVTPALYEANLSATILLILVDSYLIALKFTH